METLPRDSASPKDCSHVGALHVLVTSTAVRSKRPSACMDAFYELMLYLLCGEVNVKGWKAEVTDRVIV